VKVGEHSVVGAGAVVTRAVRPHRVVYGVPAREIRERRAGDSYLD
jgi:acetyltransferase-like isoleucine patch superfamily enzyme